MDVPEYEAELLKAEQRIRELESERDRYRPCAEERRNMIEFTGQTSIRDIHDLVQEGCRLFYLRPAK